jgi:hypothetical protein
LQQATQLRSALATAIEQHVNLVNTADSTMTIEAVQDVDISYVYVASTMTSTEAIEDLSTLAASEEDILDSVSRVVVFAAAVVLVSLSLGLLVVYRS